MVDVRKYFISYCSNNDSIKKMISELEAYFLSKEIKYYLDNADLKVNQNINDFIDKIRICENVVIFLSNDYFESWWCMKECVKALQVHIKKDNIYCITTEGFDIMKYPDVRQRFINQCYNFWNNRRKLLFEANTAINFEYEYEYDYKYEYKNEDETLKEIIKNIPKFISLVKERRCCSDVEDFIKGINEIGNKPPNDIDANIKTLDDLAFKV